MISSQQRAISLSLSAIPSRHFLIFPVLLLLLLLGADPAAGWTITSTSLVPTSGATLTITGSGFPTGASASATVDINGVDCPVTSLQAGRIRCTAPASIGGSNVATTVTTEEEVGLNEATVPNPGGLVSRHFVRGTSKFADQEGNYDLLDSDRGSAMSWATSSFLNNEVYLSCGSEGDSIANVWWDFETTITLPADEFAVSVLVFIRAGASTTRTDPRLISKTSSTDPADHDFALLFSTGYGSLQFRLTTEGVAGAGSKTLTAAIPGAVQYATYRQIVATYDGANMRLFIDGTELGSLAQVGNVRNAAKPTTLCNNPAAAGRSRGFIGSLADLKIWNTAPSQSEIGNAGLAIESASTTVSYVRPTITSTNPNVGSPAGGYEITITGNNFGTGAATRVLTLGGVGSPCSTVERSSHTQLICKPLSTSAFTGLAGTTQSWGLTVSGQTLTTTSTFAFCGADNLNFVTQPSSDLNDYKGSDFNQPSVEIRIGTSRVSLAACPESAQSLTATLNKVAPADGTLGGTATINFASGLATFSGLDVRDPNFVPGMFTLTITSGGLSTTSSAFQIYARGTQLVWNPAPATSTGGEMEDTNLDVQPGLDVLDEDNNLVTAGAHSDGTMTIEVVSGGAFMTGTLSGTAVGGHFTFSNVKFTRQGDYVIRGEVAGGPNLQSVVDSASLEIHPLATAIEFVQQPVGNVLPNTPLFQQPTFRLVDALGNAVTDGPDANGHVITVDASGTGTLGGAYAAVAGDLDRTTTAAGIATAFDVRISVAGTTVTLVASSPGLTSATSSPFTIYEIATDLDFATPPTHDDIDSIDLVGQPVVHIVNGNNVRITAGPHASLTVTAALQTGTGVLQGTPTATPPGDGIATFTDLRVTYSPFTPGANFVLRFTATALVGLTLDSPTFTVHSTATQLIIDQQPIAGVLTAVPFPTQAIIEIWDQDNRVVQTGPHSTLTVRTRYESGPGGNTGPTGPRDLYAVAGIADFTIAAAVYMANSAAFNQGITHKIEWRTLSPNIFSAPSQDLVVFGRADSLAITTQPSTNFNVFEGVDLIDMPTVEIWDQHDVLVDTGPHAVLDMTLAMLSHPALASMSITSATVTAVGGVVSFAGISFDYKGDYTLQPSVPGVVGPSTSSFEIYGRLDSIDIDTQPATLSSTLTGVNLPTMPTFSIRDTHGALISTGAHAGLTMSLSMTAGPGTMSTVADVVASGGTATFAGINFSRQGTYTVRATINSPTTVNSPVSATFVVHGLATQLIIVTEPATTFAVRENVDLTTMPVFRIADAFSSTITTGDHRILAVSLAIASGPTLGTLTSPVVNGAAGIVTFTTGVNFDRQGTYTLEASIGAPAITSPATASFQVHGTPTSIVFGTQPSTTVAAFEETDIDEMPVIHLLDFASVIVATGTYSTVAVSITEAGPGDFHPALPANINAVAGVATWAGLQFTSQGIYTVTCGITSPAVLSTGASSNFEIYGGARALAISLEPVGDVLPFLPISVQPTVDILDKDGAIITTGTDSTRTVTLSVIGTATLGGTPDVTGTFVADGDAGVAGTTNPFSVGVDMAGDFQLVASSGVMTTATTVVFTIYEICDRLQFNIQPVHSLLHTSILATQPVVHIRNDVPAKIIDGPHESLSVSLTVVGSPGTLSGLSTVTAVNGVATFSGLQISTPFTPSESFKFRAEVVYTLNSTSVAIRRLSDTFTVFATAESIVFGVQPIGNMLSDDDLTMQPVVNILDENNAIIDMGPETNLTVSIARIGGLGGLTGTTSVVSSFGNATFTDLGISAAGFQPSSTFTIEATLDFTGDTVLSTTFTVWARAVSLFMDEDPEGDCLSGANLPQQPIVHTMDQSGNRIDVGSHAVLDVTADIHAGIGGLFGGTVETSANGIATFAGLNIDYDGPGPTFVPSGTFRIIFSTLSPSLSIISPVMTIWGRATSLIFDTQPGGNVLSSQLIGAPVVHILDASLNRILDGDHAVLPVTLTMENGSGDFTGTHVLTPTAGETDPFADLQIDYPSFVPATDFRLEATTSGPDLAVISNDFTIFAVATQVVIITQPVGDVYANVLLDVMPVFELRDLSGNIVLTGPDSEEDVTLTLTGGQGTEPLDGTTTDTGVSGGAPSFIDISVDNSLTTYANDFRLTATCATCSTGSISVTTSTFQIYGVPTTLSVDTQPVGDVLPNVDLDTAPIVTARDNLGNVVSLGPLAELTMSIVTTNGIGSISAGTTSIAALAGSVTFANLQMSDATVGYIYRISMTVLGTTLTVDTAPLTIYQVAHSLVFKVQPVGDMLPLSVLATTPVVHILDIYDNDVFEGDHSDLPITLQLSGGPGGGSFLGGTLTQAASAGIASTFTDIFVNTAAIDQVEVLNFTLTATCTGLGLITETSITFKIYAVVNDLVFTLQPVGDVVSNEELGVQPVVEARDKLGNLITQGPHSTLVCILTLDDNVPQLFGALSRTGSGGIHQGFTAEVFTNTFVQPRIVATVTPTLPVPFTVTTTSVPIDVYARADHLVFFTEPFGNVPTDTPLQTAPVVHIMDKLNNLVTQGPHANLTVSLELRGSKVPPDFISVGSLVDSPYGTGIADGFTGLEVRTNGSGTDYYFRASTIDPDIDVDSVTFVIFAAATGLRFDVQPVGNVFHGDVLSQLPTIAILDSNGNAVASGDNSDAVISVSLVGGYGFETLVGTVTVTAVAGVATGFTGLYVDSPSAGSDFRLNATCDDPKLWFASNAFTVYAKATSLAWSVAPVGEVVAYENLHVLPEIVVLDDSLRVVEIGPQSNRDLYLNLTGGPPDAEWSVASDVTATAVNGVFSFTDVAITRPGLDFRIQALLDSLSLELFSANIVIYQKAVEIVYATQPFGNLENGPLLTMPEVHILDEFGQIVTTGPHSLMNVILILAGSGDPDAELRGTWENAHVTGGIATFTDLVVTLPGVGYSLAATTNLALSNETAVNTTGMYNFTVPPPPLLNVASDSFIVYGITTSVFSPTGFVELIDSGTLEYVNFLQVSTIEKMHEAVVTTDRPELFFEQPAISLLATNPTTNGTLTFATSFKRGVAKVTVVLLFGPGGSFSTPPRTFQIGVESDPGASIVSFEPTAGPSCGGYPIEVYGEFFGREERNMTRMLVGHLDCDRFEYDSDTHATCYPKFGVQTGTIGVQSTSGPMGRSIAPFVVNPIPFVDAVEPTRTPSRSAVEITLTGHGLGLDQDDIESIDLGDGILCEPITWVNDSYVTCTAPAQDAVHEGQVVVTTTSGCGASDDRVEREALGNAFFEYVGPYITSVVPDAGTTEGGTLLTISGRDFGRSAGELTGLMIADINCTDVNWRNSRTIECVTGPTAGANYSGDVYVTTSTGGLGASAPGVGYTYQLALPIITNIDPVRVPLFGGYNVTISGEEFGRKQADIIGLSLAGIDCLDGMRWISSTELVCTTANITAPRSGFVELVKWPSLATTSAPIIFEYANTTWLPAPALSRAIPGSVGTDGGDVVRLQGEFLGTNPKDILSLTIGGLPCRIISWDSPAELSCMSPPLRAGTHVVLMTTQSGGKSGDNLRIGVSYPYPEVSGFFPRIGLAAGGETVTVVGKYFGDFDEGQSVSLGGVRCTESTWISSTEMLCVIPPESAIPTGNLLTITVTNPIIGMSLASTDAYRYVPPDEICTPSCGLNADCVDGECKCRAGWAITPGCLRPVVDATVVGSTAESGATAVLEVFLHAAPVLDVTVTPASADTSEGIKIAPEVPLTFTIANWNVKQPVTVQGVADRRRDGDKTYNMVLAVASDDAFFAEMAAPRIPVVNRESAPLITKITPPLSALAGSNVTIAGINFDTVLDVYVSSKAADRESIRTQTRTILVARETEAFDSSSDSGGLRARQFIDDDEPEEISEVFMVNMWSPAMKENGYYDVKVVNEGGTETTIVDGLFYTDDCPDPGQFGRGNDCADCPVGGICPGGYRLWPTEGYWTSDEEAGFVVACEPPEACIGGRHAECAEGYEGDFCGACSVGYNRRAGECQPCPGGESFLFSLIFNAILWSLVAMSAWWLHDRENLSHVIQLVLAIQEIAGIGGMVGDKVPDWMRVIYEFMTVFAGDISFLKPDCQGRVPYELQFAVRVGYAISIGLPMVCGIPIVSWFSRRWNRDKGPEVVALIKRFYQQRLTRSFTIHATLIYLTLTTTALTSIACVKRETGYVLLSDRSQRCFTPEHTIVYAASFVILLALTLGWPLSYLFWIRRNPLRMYYDENFMMRWDFLFEPFLARFRYCFLAEFWIAFVLALSNVFFQDKPLEQLIFSGGTFFGVCCGIAIMQPFRRGWENNTMLALMVSNLLAVVYIYLSKANHLTQTTERYMIWLLVFIISVVVITLLSVVLYYIFWVWTDNRTFVPPEPSVAKQWQDAQEEASASEASVSLGNLFGDLTKKDSGDNNGDAVSSAAMSLNNVDFDAVIDQLPENDPDKEEPYMDIIRAFTSLEDYDLPGDEAREAEEPVRDDDQEPTFFETAVDLFESWQMLSTLSGFEHIVAPSESSTEESESAIPSVPEEGAADESEYEYYTSGSETRERRRTNDVVDPAAELAKQMSGKLAQKVFLERKKREKENIRRAKKGLPLLNEHGREEEGESEWSYYSDEESLPPMPPLQDIEPGFFG